MDIILTAQEVEALENLVKITEVKVEKARLNLHLYKLSQKVHVGDDTSADPGFVAELDSLKQELEYYKLLLNNYTPADLQDDKIGIGSLVSVVNGDTKKEITFLVVQEKRIPEYYNTGVKMVSVEAPIAGAIIGKQELEAYNFENANGKEVRGVITAVDNQYGMNIKQTKTK